MVRDPLTGAMLLVAPGRTDRPNDLTPGSNSGIRLPGPSPGPVPGCPFCPGAEHETPPERWALRDTGAPDTPGWRVRVVPNRYPLLTERDGVHEVIVNSHRHAQAFWDLTPAQAGDACRAWIARESAVAEMPGVARAFLFLNQGAPAGASLGHTHAQLVGFPHDPPRLAAHDAAFPAGGPCPVCAQMTEPAHAVTRVGDLVAWCPPAPPYSGLVRVAPRRHTGRWTSGDADTLGPLLLRLMRAVAADAGTDAMNIWAHQAPPAGDGRVHWHLEVLPRAGTLAGLELGTGVMPLVVDPAVQAARLRAALD